VSYTVITAPQRSPEWFAARLGRLCASDAKAMLATVAKGEAAARRDLRMRLVCERLTGRQVEDAYINADMERGVALEPVARAAYEFTTGVPVREVGFLQHAEVMAGASPDGVIGDMEGLVEIKCPRAARHLSYRIDGRVPLDYVPQLTHQLWVSGAPWVDFVSFCGDFPDDLALFVARLARDEAAIEAHDKKVRAFLAEVDAAYQAIQTMTDPARVLRAALQEA
jgi:putative phage-type endonuclease